MSDMQTVFSAAPVIAKESSSTKRWQCACDRFEKALAERLSALREQDAAEQKEFRARKATNDIKLPALLIVEVVTELYFNNGVSEPLLRRSANTLELRDEKLILAYVKDDLILRDKLLGAFRLCRAVTNQASGARAFC